MDNRLATLRRTLRLHFNWLILKLLGKDLLSKEELDELKDYGRLSLGDEVGLIEHSFALGRQSALSKKSEYKDLTLEKLSKLQKKKYSSVEELAIREAKLHTARRIQKLADEASANAYNRVNKAARDLLEDAAAKDILADEVALGIAEKKSRKQLATSVANKLGRDFSADMKKLAITEMHRAKQRGVVMAIANKVGIYRHSEGVDSMVSVVPNRGACKDCLNLYLDNAGNPRLFSLKTLMAQGSNADEGVSHSRGLGGLHTGWKPVMPPAHPSCYCELTYVPAGMAWENGKLKIVDEVRYKESISKAYDPNSMSPTIKPKGGESYQNNDPPKVGSIPGVAAPDNTAGPGVPKGSATTIPAAAKEPATAKEPTAAKDTDTCPYLGGKACIDRGGNGYKTHKRFGVIMQRHAEYMAKEGNPEEAEKLRPTPEDFAQEIHFAREYDPKEHTTSELKDHIQQGVVIQSKSLKKHEVVTARPGVTDSYKQVIKGNGSILAKPGSIDYGSEIHKEAAVFKAFVMFGSDRCPPTFIRNNNPPPVGKKPWQADVPGAASGQAWLKNHNNAMSAVKELGSEVFPEGIKKEDDPMKLIYALIKMAPDKDKMLDQLSQIAVMDLITGNSDRHVENFMVNADFSDVMAIDHGFTMEPGLNFYQGRIHEGFYANNRDLKIPSYMRERMDNTSYGDIKRGFGDEHLQEWQTAQTYLRMKYMLKIADENDGKLPFEEFSGIGYGLTDPRRNHPAMKFENFMIDFIDTHSNDPDSPEHATAKHFAEVGILMDPHFWRQNPEQWKRTISRGIPFKYEKEVRTKKAIVEYGQRWADQLRQKWNAEGEIINNKELNAAFDRLGNAEDTYDSLKSTIDTFDRKKRDNPKAIIEPALLDKFTEAKKEIRAAVSSYKDLMRETEELKAAHRSKFELIAPGQQSRFDELNRKIVEANEGNPRAKKAYRVDYGSNTKPAADIEREKRNA